MAGCCSDERFPLTVGGVRRVANRPSEMGEKARVCPNVAVPESVDKDCDNLQYAALKLARVKLHF